VLGKGGFGYRKHFREVAAVTTRLAGEQIDDINSHRMPKCFGKPGYLFLIVCNDVVFHFSIWLSGEQNK